MEDKSQSPYLDPQEIPASLVTDIATDPNGRVLQIANGRPAEILVVVPVDGTLRVASGVVYDFYQFEQPLSQRIAAQPDDAYFARQCDLVLVNDFPTRAEFEAYCRDKLMALLPENPASGPIQSSSKDAT